MSLLRKLSQPRLFSRVVVVRDFSISEKIMGFAGKKIDSKKGSVWLM